MYTMIEFLAFIFFFFEDYFIMIIRFVFLFGKEGEMWDVKNSHAVVIVIFSRCN